MPEGCWPPAKVVGLPDTGRRPDAGPQGSRTRIARRQVQQTVSTVVRGHRRGGTTTPTVEVIRHVRAAQRAATELGWVTDGGR